MTVYEPTDDPISGQHRDQTLSNSPRDSPG